ncbi:formate dehydrogenase accessory sulfurtransferase FdhD [Roseibium aggregatum]|uniref:formate dehydrogenase accessory sulfurtransferase FdhD n=1 Tax=Roseibium aggregatum TaxID=187304 RepID=UPI001A8BF520|nr:formate dehydrogenase accessory sulfurtransferase FdhD [Roseibium aggregatum]MBN8182213.1 formate dehydrogenase accessory sulfurtransferase FdhD [Roseibium aggregatum]
MDRPLSRSMPGRAIHADGQVAVARSLPEESPVALVFDGTTQAVMMATPGDIADFAVGFALSEGIISSITEIEAFEEVSHDRGIEARLWLRADRSKRLLARRRAMAGPVGCGLCGIESLDQALRPLPKVDATTVLSRLDVARATDALSRLQPLRDQTRATHAAGFLQPGNGVVVAREDVGRHNALDKLIGALAQAGTAPATGAFVLTSRLSVELVQKCAFAGCPALIAASAPTSTALRLADEAGITVAAFSRDGGFDLYAHPERVLSGVADVA